MGPAEVLGQTDHESAAGHGAVDLDGVSAGGLAGVEGDLEGLVAQGPGNVHVIAAHAVTHHDGAVGIDGDQMLVAGAPHALGLGGAAVDSDQLDGLHELQSVLLVVHLLVDAVNVDAAAAGADLLLLGAGCGGGDDTTGQNGDGSNTGCDTCHALDEVTAGNALVHLLLNTHTIYLLSEFVYF